MKLNIGFTSLTDDDFAQKGDTIVISLTSNPKFPAIGPDVLVTKGLVANLHAAIGSTGPNRPIAIDQARVALGANLATLANKLETTAGITEADLATTGFDLAKKAVFHKSPPPAPQDVRLKNGVLSREVLPRCTAVKLGGVRAYDVEYTYDPVNGPWLDGGSFPNSRAMILQNLDRAKDVWVRIRVLGTNGYSAWSDPATILVN